MAPAGTVDIGGRDPFTTGLEGVTYLGLEWVLNPIVRSDIAVPELLKSVGGDHYPERRDELVQILDVDLSWHLHAVSDGERLYAARYASGPVVNSLFVTADASAVRALHPDDARFRQFSAEARAIVSEPLGDLPGLWRAVPAGTAFVVQPGRDEQIPFTPRSPAGKRDRPSTTPV